MSRPRKPFVPGIVVLSGEHLHSGIGLHDLLPAIPTQNFQLHTPPGPPWLSAGVCTRLSWEQACYIDPDKLTVLFDGYLSDIVDHPTAQGLQERPAQKVAELYRAHGTDAFRRLRGSYSMLVVDNKNERAILLNDRLGSRPLFYRPSSDGMAIAPTAHALCRMNGARAAIDSTSVIEFAMSATFRHGHTLFKGLYKLPQAGMLTLHPRGHDEIDYYWRLSFNPQEADSEALIDECDTLLQQAVARSIRVLPNPVLSLSGGLDSRVVLGYMQRNNCSRIQVTCYWEAGTQGDDSAVAQHLSDAFDLTLTPFIIDMAGFVETAEEAVLKADCGAEVIDSAPLTRLWGQLSQRFGGFINGDECFGWHGAVDSVSGALSEIGWFRLAQSPRIADWIRPEVVQSLRENIDRRLADLVAAAGQSNPNDLKDKLYYEERLGNYLNAFSAHRLHALELARPLVDEDVIDFISRVPRQWREDKRLLRETFHTKFPDLDRLPYASTDVLPVPETFRHTIIQNSKIRQFFEENLIEQLDSELTEILDTGRFAKTVHALLNNQPLPSLHHGLLSKIPGMWRFAKPIENRIHPFILVLRILQLNLYLMALANTAQH